MAQPPHTVEVIGEGNPYRIRVTMLDNPSHDAIRRVALGRLPQGCWFLEKLHLVPSGTDVIATLEYRQIDGADTATSPPEIIVVGNTPIPQITSIDNRVGR